MSLLLLHIQGATQCGLSLGKMPVAPDPTQPWLDVEQRGRRPAMALVRSLPGVHLGAALLDQRMGGLGGVGGVGATSTPWVIEGW
jgi:hypothetical protein